MDILTNAVAVAEGITLTNALGTITTTMTTVLSFIADNEVLMIFLAAPVLGMAISFVKRLIGRL